MVVVDRAGDLSRSITIGSTEQLVDIRVALTHAGEAVRDGQSPDSDLALKHQVLAAVGEARRAEEYLGRASQALAGAAHAASGRPGLANTARLGVDEVADRLERARRSVFRLTEDLPAIIHTVEATTPDGPVPLDLDVPAATAARTSERVGVDSQQRQPPVMDSAYTMGFSPGR